VAVIRAIGESDRAYIDAVVQLLPRGPAWDAATTRTRAASQPALGAFVAGSAAEPRRLHNRFVDLIAEADPRTTSEMLEDWIEAWGLPSPCGTLPATDAEKRAQLATKWAARGGQSRAYYIGLVYLAISNGADYLASGLEWVYIDEQPYGVPFRVGTGAVGDPLNGEGAQFYWTIHMPAGEDGTLVECLIEHYKPAHTVVLYAYDVSFKGP
jgi:uncharacterized protein YmfQ (DUF2313 family)